MQYLLFFSPLSVAPSLHQHRFEYPNDQTRNLFKAILSLDTIEECESFFRDLCTLQELKSMTERWQIAQMVWQGMPYRVIAAKTGASSTTIARVSHWLTYGQGGYQKACDLLVEPQIAMVEPVNSLAH